MGLGDGIEFALLWAFLPTDRQQAVVRQIQKYVLDNLREEGIRVDGDDVAVFAKGFCVQRPHVVGKALGANGERWSCCHHISTMLSPSAVQKWLAEKRTRCTIDIDTRDGQRGATLYVDRVYRPGCVIVEYVRGITSLRVAHRTFTFAPVYVLGGVAE